MIHESLQTKKEGLESQERGGNLEVAGKLAVSPHRKKRVIFFD
jgi:hypothetical protein